jgi:hypothetical protein
MAASIAIADDDHAAIAIAAARWRYRRFDVANPAAADEPFFTIDDASFAKGSKLP